MSDVVDLVDLTGDDNPVRLPHGKTPRAAKVHRGITDLTASSDEDEPPRKVSHRERAAAAAEHRAVGGSAATGSSQKSAAAEHRAVGGSQKSAGTKRSSSGDAFGSATAKRAATERDRRDGPQRSARADEEDEREALRRTPVGLAAILVEEMRDGAKTGLALRNACCNFDLAVRFLQRHERFLAAQTALRAAAQAASKRSRASQAAATPLCVVYHGTSKSNFHKIMDGNLKVPDGRSVTHVTDDGYFGKGIYTSTLPELALAYAKDGIIFACLALPGHIHKATQKHDRGRPKRSGCDSHLGYEGDGAPQLVFFDNDQLLPIFLARPPRFGRRQRECARSDISKQEERARAREIFLARRRRSCSDTHARWLEKQVDRSTVGAATRALERFIPEIAAAQHNAAPAKGLPKPRKGAVNRAMQSGAFHGGAMHGGASLEHIKTLLMSKGGFSAAHASMHQDSDY